MTSGRIPHILRRRLPAAPAMRQLRDNLAEQVIDRPHPVRRTRKAHFLHDRLGFMRIGIGHADPELLMRFAGEGKADLAAVRPSVGGERIERRRVKHVRIRTKREHTVNLPAPHAEERGQPLDQIGELIGGGDQETKVSKRITVRRHYDVFPRLGCRPRLADHSARRYRRHSGSDRLPPPALSSKEVSNR